MNNKNSISVRMSKLVAVSLVISMVITVALAEVMFLILRKRAQNALIEQTTNSGMLYTSGQEQVVDARISNYVAYVESAAQYAEYLFNNPGAVVPKKVKHISEYEAEGVEAGQTTFHFLPFKAGTENDASVLAELESLSGLEPYLEIVREHCPMFVSMSIYTEAGVVIGYDESVQDKFGATEFDPEALGKAYYIEPKASGETYISDVYLDSFGRGLMITIASPFFVDGKFRGVIEADTLIDDINEIIESEEQIVDGSNKILLSTEGELVCASDGSSDRPLEDILGPDVDEMRAEILNNNSGILETVIGKDLFYVLYDTVEHTGWKLLVTLPEAGIVEPAQVFAEIIQKANFVMIFLCIILLLGCFLLSGHLTRKMLSPLMTFADEVAKIDGENMSYVSDIHTGDEIEAVSEKFEAMVQKITDYMQSLTKVTAEKERISTELNVATNIQASMLPCIFPAFPDREEFEIYATMNPAKEVGGDFYDFFMVDESHLAIVVADVSGKGVPAALFMVIGKTLIKDHTVPGLDLGSVFSTVNNLLCESNSEELFITAFEGVLDLKTGEFVFVNAGHEMPYIYKKSEGYVPQKIRAGFVLAGMEGMKYRGGSFQLEPGDRLFQYTDGVTEATNAHNELFGQDRLTETLNLHRDETPTDLLPNVKKAIDDFVGEAPQFDDITMLGLEIKKFME